jgi:S1-C subfamily serine protease
MQTEEIYINAVEKAAKSTVSVRTANGPMNHPFHCFPMHGVGSGIVLSDKGHILTSWHVITDSTRVMVALPDGRILGSEVVGVDRETDVAVLKVDCEDLIPAEFGDSDELKLGQPILAIGNPLGLAGGPTVTSGVVSSLRRHIHPGHRGTTPLIQTDAAINPGNSGGPLIDLKGRVIGVAAVHIPHAEGIGFAIPSNLVKKISDEIVQSGRVARPWLGIVGYEVDRRIAYFYGLTTNRGIFITELTPGGPAEKAGVRVGDVVHSLAQSDVQNMEDLTTVLRMKKIEETTSMEVERNGQKRQLQVTLGTRPF